MKKITILGSTGSIGKQSLEVVRANPNDFIITALAARSDIVNLEKQIREFHPRMVCVWEDELAGKLRERVRNRSVEIVAGMEGLLACAAHPDAEVVIAAMVGMIGIRPVMEAIKNGKDIALANKETLVAAGHLITSLAGKHKVRMLPVDSEHSAIFQSLNGENQNELSKIILTASGGPFRGKKREELQHITVDDALKHPNWSMGKKITIDSATMVNKGLEVMEAKWLFHVDIDQIKVVVQPQSIIHSMVEFKDGAVMAQLGLPDMKLPIQYALTYPARTPMMGERLDFNKIGRIDFEEPDMETFRGLKLAYEAGRIGGSMPTVYNSANEKAVALFLDRKIGFLDIVTMIESSMEGHTVIKEPGMDEILAVEKETYRKIEEKYSALEARRRENV